MGKRAAARRDGINVAQEVRAIVEARKDIKGAEVLAALREKFPKIQLNENSALVAYSNSRKKLGLTKTVAKRPKRAARMARRIGSPVASSAAAPATVPADISLLQAAKALLQHCKGDVAAAQSALKQIASLQMT